MKLPKKITKAKGILFCSPELPVQWNPETAGRHYHRPDHQWCDEAIEAETRIWKMPCRRLQRHWENYLVELLKLISSITVDKEGDVFGKIYEYFLGNFASSEGAKGGEFYTPTSLVKLIVEIIEPFHGKIFDPACGSGGMFVQSAHFVRTIKKARIRRFPFTVKKKPAIQYASVRWTWLYMGLKGISGKVTPIMKTCTTALVNLILSWQNPPFNVDKIDKERLKDDPRFPIGLPKTDKRQLPLDSNILQRA